MNYLLKINYDGTNFKGFAKQPKQTTVQGEIENAIEKLYGEKVKTTGSGRTDAGVHALEQCVSFLSEKELSCDKMKKSLNAVLPDEIRVCSCQIVDDFFNARFSAKGKIYEYRFVNELNAFNFKYAQLLSCEFDVSLVKKACKYLIGTHDFKSFSVTKTHAKDFVKTIRYIKIIKNKKGVVIRINGSGFLHNMVRIIVGTLIQVGTKVITPHKVKEILDAQDRRLAGKTAPANALFLVKVLY